MSPLSGMQFLFRFPDVLGSAFLACDTVDDIRRLTGDMLFDVKCSGCLCNVDRISKGAKITGVTSLIFALVETDLCTLGLFVLVCNGYVNSFTTWCTKHSTTLFTSVAVLIRLDVYR